MSTGYTTLNNDKPSQSHKSDMDDGSPDQSKVIFEQTSTQIHHGLRDISNDDHNIVSQTILQNINHNRDMIPVTTNDVYDIFSIDHRPYPPIIQTGIIHDHDLPYAEYGHLGKCYGLIHTLFFDNILDLDASTIANNNNFDFEGVDNQRRRQSNDKRMPGTTWAITCWSEVSSKSSFH